MRRTPLLYQKCHFGGGGGGVGAIEGNECVDEDDCHCHSGNSNDDNDNNPPEYPANEKDTSVASKVSL